MPTELITQVLSHLPVSSIECLAKTFDKRILAICLPFIQERIETRRNAKRMLATFPFRPSNEWWATTNRIVSDLWAYGKLDRKWGPFQSWESTKENPFPDVEFLMDRRGEFDWLGDWDELEDKECQPFMHRREPMTREQETMLKDQAEKLGLEFPKGFFKFIRIVEEECHVQIGGNDYFQTPKGGLMKFQYPRQKLSADLHDIGEASEELQHERSEPWEGYFLPFYTEAQGLCHWYLFLDAGSRDKNNVTISRPGHCVLISPGVNLCEEDLTPLERELGISMIDESEDWELADTSFEEFVARTYFDNMASFFRLEKGRRLPRILQRYVAGIYSDKAKEIRLGLL